MIKNILITKSQERSKEITKFLASKGFVPFNEPLFKIQKLDDKEKFAEKKYSFAIITSSNAIEHMAYSGLDKNIKIYTVGKKTTEKLVNQGFINVFYPQEQNAFALNNLILQQEKPNFGLYFHGSIVSFDFKKELENFNFKITNILSYQTFENEEFSQNLLNFTKTEKFDQILIFSENSLKIFFKLAKKHNLLEYFKQSKILVMSEKILIQAKNLGFSNSQIFADFPILKNFYD